MKIKKIDKTVTLIMSNDCFKKIKLLQEEIKNLKKERDYWGSKGLTSSRAKK